ncbi:MAG: alpha/beta hydrolase [Eubacteriales bacterium]|nr:alpha/beta hydrolase [Eubacteriales bacterium]
MEKYCEIRRTYNKLGELPAIVPCMLYEPLHPGDRSRIGVVLMHSDDDYIEFLPAIELAKRGYRVAAAHVSKSSNPLDRKMQEVGMVADFLRSCPGVDKVLLLGHSGGATLMSAYQSAAENGNAVFQNPERIIALDDIGALTPADGVMLLDSNFGNGVMSLVSLDPAIVDEETGMKRDPSLNLFNPANGYHEEGCSYSGEFISRFLRAQAERMNRLIDYCQERVEIINHNAGQFMDDEPLVIPGGTQFAPNNKLFPQMTGFFSRTKEEWNLLHQDGSVTREIVPCRRIFRPGADSAGEYGFGALTTTVKTFLKSSAVRVNPDLYAYDASELHGIEWGSSYCVTVGNVEGISAPMLMMGMTGSYEYIAAEHIYRHAGRTSDKTLAFVEGAGHNFTPATEAERYPGEFGDTAKVCFDYVSQWIASRFL